MSFSKINNVGEDKLLQVNFSSIKEHQRVKNARNTLDFLLPSFQRRFLGCPLHSFAFSLFLAFSPTPASTLWLTSRLCKGYDQEGRRGSDEVVLGTSVFPSRERGVLGNFWVSHERCQVLFSTSGRKLGLPLRQIKGHKGRSVEL